MPETFSVGYSGTGSWASGGNNNLQITITKCTVTWTYATNTCGGTSTVLVTQPVSVSASGVAVPPTAPNTSWPVGSSAYLLVKLVMYSKAPLVVDVLVDHAASPSPPPSNGSISSRASRKVRHRWRTSMPRWRPGWLGRNDRAPPLDMASSP